MKKIIKSIIIGFLLATIISPIGFLSIKIAAEQKSNLGNLVPSEKTKIIESSNEMKRLAEDSNMIVMTLKTIKETPETNTFTRTDNSAVDVEETVQSIFIPKNQILRGSGDVDGSKPEETDIAYYSATLYSTIYYKRYKDGNVEMIQLKGAEGGVKDFNSGFYLVKQEITLSSFGHSTGHPYGEETVFKETTKSSWEYSVNFRGVNRTATHNVGCLVKATIKHGTKSYTGTLNNNL